MTIMADVSAMSTISAEVHAGNSGTVQTPELMIWKSSDHIVVYVPV